MVVPGAMATRTADELATMDADELRKIVQSLQSQSQQSTSGSVPSTGGGVSAGSGQTIMMVSGKHSLPPSLNEATKLCCQLKELCLFSSLPHDVSCSRCHHQGRKQCYYFGLSSSEQL